jgi:hypothetical protein
MTTSKRTIVDPMREGHPEPFGEPRTIPGSWDVTGWTNPQDEQSAEMNGTAFNHTNPTFSTPYDQTENAV